MMADEVLCELGPRFTPSRVRALRPPESGKGRVGQGSGAGGQ
jgi:hypothetical protein